MTKHTRRLCALILALTIAAPAGAAVALPIEASGAAAARDVEAVGVYIAFVQWTEAMTAIQGDVGTFVAAVIAENAARAAQNAARRPQVPHQSASQPAGGGGSCGGATNGADRYIQRESGGNPYVYNTGGSGAYGCYQIMPYVWRSACSDLGQQIGASPATQAACASRLPLSAWGG